MEMTPNGSSSRSRDILVAALENSRRSAVNVTCVPHFLVNSRDI